MRVALHVGGQGVNGKPLYFLLHFAVNLTWFPKINAIMFTRKKKETGHSL